MTRLIALRWHSSQRCVVLMGFSKRFQRVYLHIGLGKTGSSSIQRAIMERRVMLDTDHSLHFPCIEGDPRPFNGNHSLFLSALFGSQPERQRPSQLYGLGSSDAMTRANENVLKQFEQGFRTTEATVLLFSAEGVGHYSRGRMQRMANWLYGLADELRIVACLRHPCDAFSSEVQQRLKSGSVLENLYRKPPHYSFKKVFSDLEEVFGRDSLMLYDYADASESPGGLVAEFFRQIGLEWDGISNCSAVVNHSMSQEGALLLSALNRQRPLFVDGRINPLRAPEDLLEFLSLPGEKYRAPESVHHLLQDRVAPELGWLSEHYGLALRQLEPPLVSEQGQWSQASIDALALKLHELARMRRG